MGAASRLCGSIGGSVPDVLFNIQLDPNTFRLCSKLKQCNNTACTNIYGTKDAYYQINELRLQSNELYGGGKAHGIGWEK